MENRDDMDELDIALSIQRQRSRSRMAFIERFFRLSMPKIFRRELREWEKIRKKNIPNFKKRRLQRAHG
ncbi:hypothetical protein HY491_02735 [Candidatus Woesearchaeota archaeon]|nr:hypothetical protein [Candidatus Woesearchaeota archaeon]